MLLIPEDEAEELGEPDPVSTKVEWPLNIIKAERSIYELHRQWSSGFLQLSPDDQREYVWKTEKQNWLIESVVAEVPLPVFYLSEEIVVVSLGHPPGFTAKTPPSWSLAWGAKPSRFCPPTASLERPPLRSSHQPLVFLRIERIVRAARGRAPAHRLPGVHRF
jgi:hypothetical protein